MKTLLIIASGWIIAASLMPTHVNAQGSKRREEGAKKQASTEENQGQGPKAPPEAIRALFDNSETYVPPEKLRVVDRPIAEDAADLAEKEEAVSVTSDGKVEKLASPDDIEAAFRELLKTYEAKTGDEGGDDENLLTPESVIGEDTRVRVTNTTAFPYKAAGRIDLGCTGTLIGPRHVLTAGHCVYNINTDQWYTNINFTPGQNGNAKPYGTITWTKAISVNGWTRDHNRDYDYAMIVLNQDVGTTVAKMAFGYDDALPMYNVNINGYPADKPLGEMWHSFGALKIIQPFRLYHDCDTFGGNSGSSVYVYVPSQGKRTIYGIHAYGVDSTEFNGATRINKARYDNLNKWISEN